MPERRRNAPAAAEPPDEPAAPRLDETEASGSILHAGEDAHGDVASALEVSREVAVTSGGVTTGTGTLKKRGWGLTFWIAVGWLVFVVLLAVLAGVLPLKDPNPGASGLDLPNLTPGGDHVLGTDTSGRDSFARIAFGGRVALTVGVMSVLFGMVIGGAIGLIAGFYRGRLETFLMGAMDSLLAFPRLVFALAIVAFLGQSTRNVILAIGFLSIPAFARITRANTLAFAQREFVLASRTLGAKNGRIMIREILPNVVPPVMSFAVIAVAVAVVAEGTLSFLGLGVPPPQATWGSMINEGREALSDSPHVAFIPSAVMFLTVLSLNFAGESIRAKFNFRESAL